MDAALAPTLRRIPVRGLELAVRQWPGEREPAFLLVHGLASNACTWDAVGARLSSAGYRAVAVDQRGHGRSDKPDDGYGFDEVTADLRALIDALGLDRPLLAGQSWGGNVVLDFAARWPKALSGLVLVDGGFIDLSAREDASWEQTAIDLRPPDFVGTPRAQMVERLRSHREGWPEEAIEMTMANFETLADGSVQPWLTLDRHMLILRSLWEQKPAEIYPHVQSPTLIAVADSKSRDPGWRKEDDVARATAGLAKAEVRWFKDAAHDIHIQRPLELTDWLLEALDGGFFSGAGAGDA